MKTEGKYQSAVRSFGRAFTPAEVRHLLKVHYSTNSATQAALENMVRLNLIDKIGTGLYMHVDHIIEISDGADFLVSPKNLEMIGRIEVLIGAPITKILDLPDVDGDPVAVNVARFLVALACRMREKAADPDPGE